ncbi:MAG: beta-ketoacyl-[acyl-carrier-protein] synthase family protein [Planctomycetota bacterium]
MSFCSNDSSRDVVVTGLGMVTPLGLTSADTWRHLLSGGRGCRELSPSDIDCFEKLQGVSGLRIYGAPVVAKETAHRLETIDWPHCVSSEVRRAWLGEPLIAFSLLSLTEAMQHAGLCRQKLARSSVSVVFGSSKGGLRTAESLVRPTRDDERGWLARFSNAFTTDGPTRAVAAIVSAGLGIRCPVAACATGLVSLLQGASLISSGECDVCITGSADAALRASVMSSFHRLRVTSRHELAETACRPFDRNRDGFVIGEGAATIILESRSHATARGAEILARVVSGGWLNHPTGMTQIDDTGTIVRELLTRSVPRDVCPDIVNLHGTGTETNDLAEARGVHSVFGLVPRSFGVKGAMGHLLGAAGSVETAITIMALRDRIIPGTTNLSTPDPECRLNLSPVTQSISSLTTALKLSLGFGGHVACGLFERESASLERSETYSRSVAGS